MGLEVFAAQGAVCKRLVMQPQRLGGMGRLEMRTSEPGEERVDILSYLSGLQGEFQKSREWSFITSPAR